MSGPKPIAERDAQYGHAVVVGDGFYQVRRDNKIVREPIVIVSVDGRSPEGHAFHGDDARARALAFARATYPDRRIVQLDIKARIIP